MVEGIMSRSPVNSYTEWGPLKEVIIGDFANSTVPKTVNRMDWSFRSFYNNNLIGQMKCKIRFDKYIQLEDVKLYPDQIQKERDEDIENLCGILQKLDIEVKRPDKLQEVVEIKSPYWTNVSTPAGNVRDQFLVIGDEIIETSCLIRGRYFENDLLKNIFLDYFKQGAKWTLAPRPRMEDTSFDRSYFDENPPEVDLEKFEIMFDGAQCLRFGEDIIFNVANINHELGAMWLQRHLGEKFRVHQVRITDNHIDGMFLPLRPGFLIIKSEMQNKLELLPKKLQTWDYIIFQDFEEIKNNEELLLASKDVNLNVLSLSEEMVVINEKAINTIRLLEKAGFIPIPVRLRHSRMFAGAFHCSSLDIYRQEQLERYW